MKGISILLVALLMVMGLSATAHSDLIVRGTDTLGNQLIYDTDFDITWYDYTPDSTDIYWWSGHVAWADALTVDFGGTVYDDWRLPTALNQDGSSLCAGAFCIDSEMGHLFYTEMVRPADGTGPFTNLLTGSDVGRPVYYWTSTPYADDPLNYAWVFDFDLGEQHDLSTSAHDGFGFAVRDGDVSAVPEPGTMLLLGVGLAGMALVRKRFGRTHR